MIPAEAHRARFYCDVGERFGTPPWEVPSWPASTLRTLEADALYRKAREAREAAKQDA